jgi:predicted pyridoxine 5'-phosphate oxidase superfamily flavin-nucleotide-binding protein
VLVAREANGSAKAYAFSSDDEAVHDTLGEPEAAFIAARDSFYMATVSANGFPYIQHRGGPAGFVKVLSETEFAFADFRGNRQFLSAGNAETNDRVSLFFMDYPNRRRLKLLGRIRFTDLKADPALAAALALPGYRALPERAALVRVEAFDWNCPQHITPRFSEAEIATAVLPLHERLEALEAENKHLREQINKKAQ